jgi:hypothetical protein
MNPEFISITANDIVVEIRIKRFENLVRIVPRDAFNLVFIGALTFSRRVLA